MIRISRWLTLAVMVMTSSLPGAAAQGQSQGRGRGNSGSDTVTAVVIFKDSDRVVFRDYFLQHKFVAEPLPPGIAKNVARGKRLPPGIAKKVLPADLLARAPKVDRDVSFAIVGDVVVAVRGGVVLDLMVGLFK